MTDPKRILDGGGTDLEQILLASGRAARPKATARWKTEVLFLLAGLGVVAKVKAALPGSKLSARVVMRYLAYGLGTSATAWGAAHVLANRPSDPPAVEVAHVARPPASPRPVESPRIEANKPDPAVERPLQPSEATTVHAPAAAPSDRNVTRATRDPRSSRSALATGSSTPPAASSTLASEPAAGASVGGEIEELDRARGALSGGDARGAISALDRYQRAFPKGVLQQEALRLRVEAFVAAGDRATARSLADRFRVLYPNSPHAKRLNSLVHEP